MHWYADGGSGWVWGMHLVWWLFWIMVVIGVWWAITRGSATGRDSAPEPPLEVLRRRYAEGALSTEEFEERRKVLVNQEGGTV